MRNKKKIIAVIGLGYVGLPLAVLADKKGYQVIGIVKNPKKAELINKKIVPFEDKELEKKLKKASVFATIDFSQIKKAGIIIICVPTPVKAGHIPDLEPIRSSTARIGENLQKGQVVILESTVNPAVCDDIILPILEKKSGLKVGKDFYLSHCPERINPGDTKWNVENINRVVGSYDEPGLKKTVRFYESILTGKVIKMGSLKEAEAVKIVENSFRDINIAFVNELALSFSKLNIDVVNVIKAASTKPFSFLAHYPGAGVGGHCIPVDPYYLISYAKNKGFNHRFLALAREINNSMPEFVINRLAHGLKRIGKKIKGAKICVLGLAYKPDIDDIRESPAVEILKILKSKKARISIFDPHVPDFSTASSLDQAISGADAVVIATAHKEFIKLLPGYFLKKGINLIIDGRNCLQKELFSKTKINYLGIGR